MIKNASSWVWCCFGDEQSFFVPNVLVNSGGIMSQKLHFVSSEHKTFCHVVLPKLINHLVFDYWLLCGSVHPTP